MTGDSSTPHQEIVIVRRRGGDDGAAAKGGAWKIAYADFVTAMMAFFLVMWLINASNEETRAQVASYFNPIKLTDSSTGKRGLKDKKDSKAANIENDEGEAGGVPPSPADTRHEAALMANPDQALATIEAKTLEMALASDVDAEARLSNLRPNRPERMADGIGDPFDPQSAPQVEAAVKTNSAKANGNPVGRKISSENTDTEGSVPAGDKPGPNTEGEAGLVRSGSDGNNSSASEVQPPSARGTSSAGPTAPISPPSSGPAGVAPVARPTLAEELRDEIAGRLGPEGDRMSASIEVRSTDKGTLISLTDKQTFGMFKNGSAEPEPEMVRLVETIADVLKSRPGYIVIRGHTDSRPYRNKKYDNWQLSTARAHLAQYMLLRGGLDGSRIKRIEGVADRDLKKPDDPEAPENRRIEILLGEGDP